MADQKISELTELTVVDGTLDKIPIVDASEADPDLKTKGVVPNNLPVSTATQTALDAKMDEKITENEQTDNYTLVLTDENKNVNMNKGTAVNLTIPPNSSVAFGIGTQILFMQGGAGQVTIVPGSGVTIQCYNSRNKTIGQYAGGSLVKRGTNTWWMEGNLTT